MEQQLIINGLPTQQIKKVKMYVRIVSKRYADDLNTIAENRLTSKFLCLSVYH